MRHAKRPKVLHRVDITPEAVRDALALATLPVTAKQLAQGICARNGRAYREKDRAYANRVMAQLLADGRVRIVGHAAPEHGRPARLWVLVSQLELPSQGTAA